MPIEQVAAMRQLKRALNRCADAGLRGGVYDGSFCLWPTEAGNPLDYGGDFFAALEDQCGGCMVVGCRLDMDGGAGN